LPAADMQDKRVNDVQDDVAHTVRPTAAVGVWSPPPKLIPFNVSGVPMVCGQFTATTLLSTGASYVKRPNAVPTSVFTSNAPALTAILRPWPLLV
jgi:hypothetical protein